jgi:hypothetical protein
MEISNSHLPSCLPLPNLETQGTLGSGVGLLQMLFHGLYANASLWLNLVEWLGFAFKSLATRHLATYPNRVDFLQLKL